MRDMKALHKAVRPIKILDALHIEDGHVTDYALKWPIYLHFGQKKVRIDPFWVSGLLVLVVLGLALDPCDLAALMRVWIGKSQTGIQADFRVQPAVTVRWIFKVVFPEQCDVADEASLAIGWIGKVLLPVVETVSFHAHRLTEQLDRKHSGQFQDHLILVLSYRITAPSPFTS